MFQKVTTMIKPTKEDQRMMWESFSVGNTKLLGSEKEVQKYVKAIDDLGLNGQKDLIARQDGKVIPFPKLTRTEVRIWENYAPHKSDIVDFSDSIIPLEIMELVALVKANDYFGHIEIWSETREDIDPIVIGKFHVLDGDGKDKGRYYDVPYLIARRGHSLRPFDEIVGVVKKELQIKTINKIKRGIDTLQLCERNIEDHILEYLNGNRSYVCDTIYFN